MNRLPLRLLAVLLLAAAAGASHADFAFAVSPPRFELAAKPGEKVRQVMEITNVSTATSALLMRTADWELKPDASVTFHNDLQPGSCRPWVAIERRELVVNAKQAYRFRFEVTPPPGQPPVECRFAILLEGKDATVAADPRAAPPVAGRMGVIVYLAVGDVKPDLSVASARVETRNNEPVLVLDIRNTGTAHGRLDGFLTATDATGQVFEATPATTPIMPGETRPVALGLAVRGAPKATARPQFPLALKGKLEWGKGRSTEVDQRIAR